MTTIIIEGTQSEVIKIDDNTFKIKDATGNTITVNKEQLKLLSDAADKITTGEQLILG
jgi:preprotein translocase subunit YajC|tara:strand:+ start:2672 stop:2845 length:174 start_codon:yes stop_codon:yes gene_type:complete